MLSKVCFKVQFLSQPDRGDPAVYFVWFGGLVLRPLLLHIEKGLIRLFFEGHVGLLPSKRCVLLRSV